MLLWDILIRTCLDNLGRFCSWCHGKSPARTTRFLILYRCYRAFCPPIDTFGFFREFLQKSISCLFVRESTFLLRLALWSWWTYTIRSNDMALALALLVDSKSIIALFTNSLIANLALSVTNRLAKIIVFVQCKSSSTFYTSFFFAIFNIITCAIWKV